MASLVIQALLRFATSQNCTNLRVALIRVELSGENVTLLTVPITGMRIISSRFERSKRKILSTAPTASKLLAGEKDMEEVLALLMMRSEVNLSFTCFQMRI